MDGNLQQRFFKPTACINHEELRQYLGGRMSREGLRRVEDHLLDCPLCSDAIEGCEESGNHLTDDLEDFEAFSKKLPGQPTAKVRQLQSRGYFRQAVAVAALLVVGALAYFNYAQAPNGPRLYAKYYVAYENDIPISQRRTGISDVDPNLGQALVSYSDHNYSQAAMLFERALNQEPANEAARFFTGLTYLELNETDKASNYLSIVANGKGVYSKKAAWYLILSDLKAGKLVEAKSNLDRFIDAGEIKINEALSLRNELQ